MSTRTPLERAKLGTTHLIPKGILTLGDMTCATAIGTSISKALVGLERAAADADHLVLWHTLKITSEVAPVYQSVQFRVAAQTVTLAGNKPEDLIEQVFTKAMEQHVRRLQADAIEESLG